MTEEHLKGLRTAIEAGKAVIGTDRVLKLLKQGGLKTILLASNCPKEAKESITHYAKMAQVPVVTVNHTNEELGVYCKKNFFVAVAGITE